MTMREADKVSSGRSLPERLARQLPWAGWAFWPWLRYLLRWKGWRAQMADNEPYHQQRGWKLHRCPDGHQCRASIPGGCAGGWCGHFEVKPDETFVPRFPRNRWLPPPSCASKQKDELR